MKEDLMEFYGVVPLWWFASVSSMSEMQKRYTHMEAPSDEEKAKGMILKLVRKQQ